MSEIIKDRCSKVYRDFIIFLLIFVYLYIKFSQNTTILLIPVFAVKAHVNSLPAIFLGG
ncbi:MAG: hypothetical protein N3E50_08335 [Candidatus Goldbacteria bacterium]|nr:hypothetical protein [Candidatus Goldiibacteriota bacterium]